MRTSLALVSALVAFTSAFPITKPITQPSGLNPLDLLSLIPKYMPAPAPGSCPVNNVQLPSSALPSPNSGLDLALVAVGRGTQNYTCADSAVNTVPVAIGANATLFNASCIASKMSGDVLAQMTEGFYQLEVSQMPLDQIGQHFFVDTTTPTFVINGFGTTMLKKSNTTNAPNNTLGDVAWLKLDVPLTETNTQIKEVYRLNTQGGSPPTNCSGQAPSFQVQYAADYFFFA